MAEAKALHFWISTAIVIFGVVQQEILLIRGDTCKYSLFLLAYAAFYALYVFLIT